MGYRFLGHRVASSGRGLPPVGETVPHLVFRHLKLWPCHPCASLQWLESS
jgi:hypothetical protein